MSKLIPLKASKGPEESLLIAARALENRDCFDPTTVMDLAEQAIGVYLANRAPQRATVDICGHVVARPPTPKEPNPEGGVRQG